MLKFAIAAIAASFLTLGVTTAEAAPAKPKPVAKPVASTTVRVPIRVTNPNAVKPVCPPRAVPSRH
jgi:hypothetical protein